jgi:hypothetical protein
MRSLLLIFFIFPIALFAIPNTTDRERLLLGTWTEEITDGPIHLKGEKTFYAGGVASGWFKVWQRSENKKEELVADVTFKSRWRIEGEILISYEVRTKPEAALDPNEEIRDTIISIDGKEFRYRSDDGEIQISKKKA